MLDMPKSKRKWKKQKNREKRDFAETAFCFPTSHKWEKAHSPSEISNRS